MRIEVDTATDKPDDIRKVARLLLAMAGSSNVYENEPSQPLASTSSSRNIFDLPVMGENTRDQTTENKTQTAESARPTGNALDGFAALFGAETTNTPSSTITKIETVEEKQDHHELEVY